MSNAKKPKRPASPNASDHGLNAESADGERIAKVLARAGVASRREAERLIEQGIVTVDGVTLETPAVKVRPGQDIRVDGTRIGEPAPARLWRFHKPAGLVTTHNDPQGRPTVFDAVADRLPRVISVGRLDLTTEGLLLMTNDGGLARALEAPSSGWTRRYRVRAYGRTSEKALHGLRDGLTVEGVTYGPIRAEIDSVQGGNTWLKIAINEGKNREVRAICRSLGLTVNRLIRVSFGPFQLGRLGKNELEEIPRKQLREQLGAKLCTTLGIN
ncbi:MAG: pseudouridine synthase [Pseudomonadota bacterium]